MGSDKGMGEVAVDALRKLRTVQARVTVSYKGIIDFNAMAAKALIQVDGGAAVFAQRSETPAALYLYLDTDKEAASGKADVTFAVSRNDHVRVNLRSAFIEFGYDLSTITKPRAIQASRLGGRITLAFPS